MTFFRLAPLLLGLLAVPSVHAQPALALRDVVLVGSNWDGTAEIVDARSFKVLKRIDIAPDRAERLKEIDDGGIKRKTCSTPSAG